MKYITLIILIQFLPNLSVQIQQEICINHLSVDRHSTIVDLSYNNLYSIDQSIVANLNTISSLILHHNHIYNLSNSKLNSSSLKTLDLRSNRIEFIPLDTFVNLVNLEILDLKNNRLKWLKDINLPIKLKELILSSNRIKAISHNFFEKLNLTKLDLRMNEIVTLNGTGLENLSFLTHLYLGENTIDFLHENMLLSSSKTLRVLNIESNYFKSLNFGLENLVNLKKLSASFNLIQQVKNDLFKKLEKLDYLDLSSNDLKHYPLLDNALPSLRVFKINNNSINKISKSFLKFSK